MVKKIICTYDLDLSRVASGSKVICDSIKRYQLDKGGGWDPLWKQSITRIN